jgi:hypothetical protein
MTNDDNLSLAAHRLRHRARGGLSEIQFGVLI